MHNNERVKYKTKFYILHPTFTKKSKDFLVNELDY